MRRVVGILRDVNDELVRANEAIFRPAGAPRPGSPAGTPSPPAGTPASSATIVTGNARAASAEHTGRAA